MPQGTFISPINSEIPFPQRQHQETTIAQLHREVTQWKDQSRNWQEHFLRVEQERCRLTVLLEEFLTENQVVSGL
jgi:hypothetical protein